MNIGDWVFTKNTGYSFNFGQVTMTQQHCFYLKPFIKYQLISTYCHHINIMSIIAITSNQKLIRLLL